MTAGTPRVMVWNEHRQEALQERVRSIYPQGIHEAIAQPLRQAGFGVRTATLDEPGHGLTQTVLDETEVLLWWGHAAHEEVRDDVVERVRGRVLDGMGLIALHSAHESKIFKLLMGTTCKVLWREVGEKERLWAVDPAHPVAAGLPEQFEIPKEEMYGEPTDIPAPEELVFISWFQGGEVFRSGGCYRRGRGKIFYFRPGHETFPVYHQEEVRRVLVNAVRWAAPGDFSGAPTPGIRKDGAHRPQPLEPLPVERG
jgi:trehalose utilization protein